MIYDSNCLDTENRDTGSTLSVPKYTINNIKFKKNDKIRFSIVVPPIQNITDSNHTITIDTVDYTITNGFYRNIEDVIKAFNTAITTTAITITFDTVTALITISHASTNFVLTAIPLLGFTSNQTGDKTYTSSMGAQLGRNTICFCSNMISLFSQINTSRRKETYHPKNYIISWINNVVNCYSYVQSEWLTVNTDLEFSELVFAFGYTSTSNDIITNIIHNWSVVFEIQRS